LTHRFISRWVLTALGIFATLLLSGCGGQVPPSAWPGLTAGNGVVYLTGVTNVYAINVADGTKKWEYTHQIPQAGLFGSGTAPDKIHTTPVLKGDTLYLGTDGGYLLALDAASGHEKWPPFQPESPATFIPFVKEHPTPVYAAPAVTDKNVVFIGNGNKVYAVDAATGKPAKGWESLAAGSRVWGNLLVVNDTIYITTLGHKLLALDAATGKLRWAFDKPQGALAGAPVWDNGVIYIGSFDKQLYAVDAATGQERWSHPFNANNWIWEGPVVISNTLYFGDLGGNVYALDAATQKLLWAQPFQAGGAVRATPLYAEGVLYVGTDNGTLYALNAETGQPVWTQPFKVPNARFLTTPVLQNGLLLVAPLGTPTQLYGLDPSNGQTRWQFPMPSSK